MATCVKLAFLKRGSIATLLPALLLGGCGLLRIDIVYPDEPTPETTPATASASRTVVAPVEVTPSPTTLPQAADEPVKPKTGELPPKAEPTATESIDPTQEPALPTGTPEPQPPPTDTPPPLEIVTFDVATEGKSDGGKVITCTWETRGATRVRILVGTARRFMPWREVAPRGTVTFDLATTLYNNPDVTLIAFGDGDTQVQESITLDWPCAHDYFFESGDYAVPASAIPQVCPANAPFITQGSYQPFEKGLMIWLEDVEGRDVVYVLYDNYVWDLHEDTWEEGEPDRDPLVIPPEGRQQPIRGFGKVWREQPEVRDRLGWATAGETAYSGVHQREIQESIGGTQYVRTIDGRVIKLAGLGGYGSMWAYLPER
ncbi:MAG: hypothetical protein ACP5JG_05080 [Anaerolineae bacterium]